MNIAFLGPIGGPELIVLFVIFVVLAAAVVGIVLFCVLLNRPKVVYLPPPAAPAPVRLPPPLPGQPVPQEKSGD